MGMAVLGVVESFVLDQFHGGVEEIAAQVGELLEQIITSPQRGITAIHLGKVRVHYSDCLWSLRCSSVFAIA